MSVYSFLPLLSSILENKIAQSKTTTLTSNFKSPNSTQVTVFHSCVPPPISISKYLLRITKYAKCQENQFILALIYIDRYITKNPSFQLNDVTIHRILFTSIVIALKYDCDYFYNNATYAKVGGISLRELNLLEKDLLSSLDYNLYVSFEEFHAYYNQLTRLTALAS